MVQLRKTIGFYLEDLETPVGKTVNLGIIGLVLISSAIFVAESYPISDQIRQWLDLFDRGILTLFVIEYLLRLWCADDRPRYLLSLYSIIDLTAILPVLTGISNISFIRVFRWFRILRLLRFIQGKTFLGYITNEDSLIFTRILFTLFSIIFVFSGLIYQVEHPHNPKLFATFLDAVYFSVSTLTTAGFGDVVPISQTGRFLTVLMIITGVVLIPWQLGDLIRQLVKTSDQSDITCPACHLQGHAADAQFCKHCGTKLP